MDLAKKCQKLSDFRSFYVFFDLLTPKKTLKLKFDLVRPTYCNLGVPKNFNFMKFSVRALLDPHISRFISFFLLFSECTGHTDRDQFSMQSIPNF